MMSQGLAARDLLGKDKNLGNCIEYFLLITSVLHIALKIGNK